MDNNNLGNYLDGVLGIWEESGFDENYLVFQDNSYIHRDVPTGVCGLCRIILKKEDGSLLSASELEQLVNLLKANHPDSSYCKAGEHVEEIEDIYDYRGKHVLKEGDYLAIYDPATGKELFSDNLHFDKKGDIIVNIDMAVWTEYFQKEYPARLIPKPE